MPNAIALRSDFTGAGLRGLARRRKDAAQARRLLALAVIYDGRTLRGMGLRKLAARPKHHAQAEGAIAAFRVSFA